MVSVLTGSNAFLVSSELKRRVAEFVEKHGDLALERLDGEEVTYERIAESCQSMPFLAEAKLVVLTNPSSNKTFQEKFEQLLPTMAEGVEVLIVETKLDKRTTYFKTLKKLTDFHEYIELDTNGLATWAVEYTKMNDTMLTKSDAIYLIERVGTNQQLVMQEIQKLALYDPKITRTTIDLLTTKTPHSTIFELLEAAFHGDHKRAHELYAEQKALKVEPQQILALVAWQLHAMAVVKAAGDTSVDEIAAASKLNPFVVRKTAGLVRTTDLRTIRHLVKRALELDIKLKSQNIDADEALQHFLLTIK